MTRAKQRDAPLRRYIFFFLLRARYLFHPRSKGETFSRWLFSLRFESKIVSDLRLTCFLREKCALLRISPVLYLDDIVASHVNTEGNSKILSRALDRITSMCIRLLRKKNEARHFCVFVYIKRDIPHVREQIFTRDKPHLSNVRFTTDAIVLSYDICCLFPTSIYKNAALGIIGSH